ncbi:MAG: universal stress protein [Rhodovibrionaceae bacterium]
MVEFAELNKPDCIDLGRRGMADIEGVFLGSVSFKVNSLASCTVITVK